MLVQRVLLPATRRESWTVPGDDGPVRPIERYLAYLTDAVAVLRANRARTGEYIPGHHEGRGIDLSFAGQSWQATLRDRHRPGKLRRRHFEVCVFAHLAAELGTRDIVCRS